MHCRRLNPATKQEWKKLKQYRKEEGEQSENVQCADDSIGSSKPSSDRGKRLRAVFDVKEDLGMVKGILARNGLI
jgi:hypothetical protein